MSLQSLIFHAVPFAMIPPLLLAIMLIRGSNLTIKILSIHIMISAVVECGSALLWAMKINNIFLLHLYTLEEFALLSWFYSSLISGSKWALFFRISIVVFSILSILNSIFLQAVTVNNTYARALESLICMIYALICFHKMINYPAGMPKPYVTALLLINSGIMIYFTSSSLLFTLSNYLRKPGLTDARMTLWTFHAFFCTIYYLLLFIGLWIMRKAKLHSYYLQAPSLY